MPVYRLSQKLVFPSPHLASHEGLLAVGGDLSINRLLLAYRLGIFPWYSEGEPILWWSPDPRLVLYPDELKTSRSLNKVIKRRAFKVTMDRAFEEVISECARVRLETQEGTWIVDEMVSAYCRLHTAGFAHSVEAWREGRLAGGLYGVSLGKCFFGESMFTRVTNASKVALVALVNHLKALRFDLIDCQIATTHLKRFGAREISRVRYLKELNEALIAPTLRGSWELTSHH
ncbi:MAG: leucyl/phenylalanyl-tRNA--protein transferase [Desulfobacterales bacterium]|jgi:leucyl/phenylalanyl-tRNA--protein transferase